MTDAERNKATLQCLYDDVMNGHDVDAADRLITPDRPDHDPTFPPEFTRDREGFKRLLRMIPPTARSFTISNVDFCRFTHDGLIAEHWGLVDMASMLRQLGVAG